MERIIELVLFAFVPAYFVGSIVFGYIIGKIKGIDIRQFGSGNIGATNVWRVLGKQWGIPTFILDFLKVPVAGLLIKYVHPGALQSDLGPLLVLVGGVIGHNYPIWLKFKGGKGIATSAGGLLWLLPYPFIVVVVVWLGTFLISRFVSLASIVSAAVLPIAVLVMNPGRWTLFVFCTALAILAIWRHRQNMQRLMQGTEMGWKKAEAKTKKE